MTYEPDAVQAQLAAELSRAERQIDDAEKAMLHATICFGAARATIANVRAALEQPRKPFRKLTTVVSQCKPVRPASPELEELARRAARWGLPRFDLVQSSGKPSDAEIERRFISPHGDGGDDAAD